MDVVLAETNKRH